MPSLGQLVQFTLAKGDARFITENRKRSEDASFAGDVLGPVLHGTGVAEGDTYAALVVRVHSVDPDEPVSLQVFLDGNDVFWASRRYEGSGPGCWSWPDM